MKQARNKNKNKKKIKIFSELRQSLQEAVSFEQGDEAGLRVTELPPPPKPLTPHQIRAIRKSFNVSQVVFARIINVSPNAVEVGNKASDTREKQP